MEYSSQLYEAAEECESSESGWTTYIGSHIKDDYDGEYVDHDDVGGGSGHGHGHGGHACNENEDSDDSMASDASSGPSQRHYLYKNGEVDDGMAHFGHEEEHDEDNIGGSNYNKKPMENQRSERRSKEKAVVKATETSSHSVGSKLRSKKLWLGKTK